MIGLQFSNFSNVNFKGNLNQKNSNVQNKSAQMQEDEVSFTSKGDKTEKVVEKVAEEGKSILTEETVKNLIENLRKIDVN